MKPRWMRRYGWRAALAVSPRMVRSPVATSEPPQKESAQATFSEISFHFFAMAIEVGLASEET
ncbi:hypothetical protein NL526_30615, partial [Klebsiella pneumoniae]|nr:hypothetical protein [Klebsiella pneumoniae]